MNPVTGRVLGIDGPVISTADLRRQCELFESVIGMQRLAEDTLDRDGVAALFGPVAERATLRQLVTPGSPLGVWLVQFEPVSDVVIREGGVGVACNALKMIDFFTADRIGAIARLREHGFEIVAEGAHIDLPDGSRFLEAHAKGPDGVMIAAIEPLNVPAGDFVTLTGRTFSEVQSSSGPVSDFEPVRGFYEEVLGVPMGLRYEFHSESFSRMVGVDQTLHIRANNYGRVVEDAMLGIIHYGLPPGTYADLRERARPPNRGIVGVRLRVEGLDAILQRCEQAGVERVRDPATIRLHSGTMRIAAVRAPHGVWHWLIEPFT
jgi:catechol 2,3-dioxygenase-like lactoylglutathione lyase family enzyme